MPGEKIQRFHPVKPFARHRTSSSPLALAHLATPFALRGKDNQDLGQVKASGLYLTESGKAGSLQEIDLTV
ncbi:MAG: hypothetical protein ACYCWC_03870 [Rhodocyclaceae bacterium]